MPRITKVTTRRGDRGETGLGEGRSVDRRASAAVHAAARLAAPIVAALPAAWLSAAALLSGPALSPGPPAGGEPQGDEPARTASAAAGEGLPPAAEVSRGLDRERLAAGVERIGRLAGVRSLLVMRGGEVVADESFAGADLNRRPHDVKSASKSLLSALVGIALERGLIDGVDATVAELLPRYARRLPAAKRAITLGHLLAMESGLASTSGEHYGAWVTQDDWTAAALARPLESEPGSAFTYSTGNAHLVSAILTEASGRATLELAREALLDPLGIEVAGWERSPEGYYLGGNSLRMTPRDLARFGRLYLQQGRWEGRQLVPRAWIEVSTRRHSEGWPDRYGAYGYFWWLPPGDPWDSFAAIGYGGQLLYAVPELDMLAVVTSTLESKGEEWDREAFTVLRDGIFGAALPAGVSGAPE
jgi:CubicO group peptidase (beta-lactamase class C family)